MQQAVEASSTEGCSTDLDLPGGGVPCNPQDLVQVPLPQRPSAAAEQHDDHQTGALDSSRSPHAVIEAVIGTRGFFEGSFKTHLRS